MVGAYIYFFLFQLINTYFGVFSPINPYVCSALFIVFGFSKPISLINLKLVSLLLGLIICFTAIYSTKFSFLSSFSITAKAIQFNYGYFFLIPGFTVLFTGAPKIKLRDILTATFWIISSELLLEFFLIRLFGISPGAFAHYPKVSHIVLDQITGEYTADRLLGIAGNASVTGVLYTTSFILYLGSLYSENKKLTTRKSLVAIVTFIICFFMIISGSAFFAILLATFVVWSQRSGSLVKNVVIALLIVPSFLILFNYISSLTDALSNKFTTEYLLLLFLNEDLEGTLPYLLNEMSKDYHWYNFFIGSYYFEWGNPNAVIKTVDYFYVNVVYEFGIFGLIVFFYPIKMGYNALLRLNLIDKAYLKMGFLVIIFGSLHYPAIAYMSSQVFLSGIIAIALRDSKYSLNNSRN